MANAFTPEQIAQILEEFFKTVGTRQYIGARYVPIFGRKDEESIEWDNSKPYEPLTIVLYLGNSYTSRQYVPAGVQITNDEFWAVTGNYNAQIEEYRRETARALQAAQDAQDSANAAQTDIDTLLPKADFSAENTVKKYIDDSVAEVQADIDTLLPKADFSAENTVKKYIDDSVAEVQADIDTLLPKVDFSAENTVKKYIDDSIRDNKTQAAGIWGISRVLNTSNEHYLMYSDDGIHFSFKKKLAPNVSSDSSAVINIGDWFYYIGNRTWQKSKDLVTWTDPTQFEMFVPISDARVWGSSVFVGANEKIYVLHSVQYNADEVPLTGVGGTSWYFRIDAYELQQMDNGDLLVVEPNNPINVLGGYNNESYIDPYAIYDVDYGIVFAAKNEVTSTIEIYRGSSITNLQRVSMTNNLIGVEGPQLIIDSSKNIYVYVHGYDAKTISAHEDLESSRLAINGIPNAIWRCKIASGYHQTSASTAFGFESAMLWELVTFPSTMRHVGLAMCTDKVFAEISKFNSIPYEDFSQYDVRYRSFPTTSEATADEKVVLTNSPKEVTTLYAVRGTPANVTVEYRRIFRHRGIMHLFGATSQGNISNAVLKIGSGIEGYSASTDKKLNLTGLYQNGIFPMYAGDPTLTVPSVAI